MGVDLLPTILEALGLPAPDGMNGESLLPLLRGERTYTDAAGSARRLRIAQHKGQEAYRFDERWKVVLERDRDRKVLRAEFFDLVNDPRETTNLLLAQPEHPQYVAARTEYREWRKQTAALDAELRGTLVTEATSDPELAGQLDELGYITDD